MLEYLQAFHQGLINVLPFTAQGTESFLYMMLGMAIGFAVGVLPGLGGATTLALMLPFIYNMNPTTEVDPVIERQRTVAIGCWIVGFFLAIWMFGFVPASAVATFLYLKFGAREKW